MWTSYRRLLNSLFINKTICIAYKSHYEALNISKTATHKEIKDAYYRLSMIYHPDKNKGCEEAAKKFRDITSAYEVLGNVRQRKLYDGGADLNQKKQQYKSYKSPFKTVNTKSDVYKVNSYSRNYDFDEWSRTHYTNIFQEGHTNQRNSTRRKEQEQIVSQQQMYNTLLLLISVSIFGLFLMFDYVKNAVKIRNNIQLFKKDSKPD